MQYTGAALQPPHSTDNVFASILHIMQRGPEICKPTPHQPTSSNATLPLVTNVGNEEVFAISVQSNLHLLFGGGGVQKDKALTNHFITVLM